MGRSSLERLCFFIAVVRRGSSLAAHLHILHAKDFFGTGLCAVHKQVLRLRTCGPRESRSTRSRSVFRNAYLLATAMRAKFALGITFRLQTRGDSPVAADRRPRAVEHEASGQRRTTCPHAGVLVKDPVQPVRCAGVSAMEGRLDTRAASRARLRSGRMRVFRRKK
jgi:hypothetical protein